MFCKYCGKELADDVKFCSGCGKQLAGELDSGQSKSEEKPTSENNGRVSQFETKSEPAQYTPSESPKSRLVAKTKKAISLITILLLAEFTVCCFQIYKVKDSLEMLEVFQIEAASAQYVADSYPKQTEAQERVFGKSLRQSVSDAAANQAWEYVIFAEKRLTKNIILLVLYLIVFIVTIIGFIKATRDFKQN